MNTFPADVEQGDASFMFLLSGCKQGSFHSVLRATSFALLCFFLVILLSDRAPLSTEVPSGAPKHKKAVLRVMEKTRVSHERRSGVSYTVVGWELDARESTIHIK